MHVSLMQYINNDNMTTNISDQFLSVPDLLLLTALKQKSKPTEDITISRLERGNRFILPQIIMYKTVKW